MVLIGAALLFAFSPTLIDWLQHALLHPWARACLIFPLLAFIAARAGTGTGIGTGAGRAPSPLAWAWVAIGLGVQLVAIAGDAIRLGRVGAALAAIGACRALGLSSLSPALLLLWAVPVPHALMDLASPGLEGLWASLSAGFAGLFGLPVARLGTTLSAAGSELILSDRDGGLVIVVSFLGLAWFERCQRGTGWGALAVRSLAWGAAGFGLQALAVMACTLSLGRLVPGSELRWLLDQWPWAVVWSAAAILVVRARGARDPNRSTATLEAR